jgi:NADH pyrophosphatase NudC (nudix superfamily)
MEVRNKLVDVVLRVIPTDMVLAYRGWYATCPYCFGRGSPVEVHDSQFAYKCGECGKPFN